MAPESSVRFMASIPILAAKDVRESAEFYRDRLGFQIAWFWTPEDCRFGSVWRESIEIFLSWQPDLAAKIEGLEHYFSVDDLDSLHEEHRRLGAPIVADLEAKPWGLREYVVRDLNGYRLRFTSPVVERGNAPAELPEGVTLEVRVPTVQEFLEIEGLVNPGPVHTNPEKALGALLAGVIALDASGRAVGMACAAGDGVNVIYIQDVAVLPDLQRQGIGSALMRLLMSTLRERYEAGRELFLLTGKPAFYTPFGFKMRGGFMGAKL